MKTSDVVSMNFTLIHRISALENRQRNIRLNLLVFDCVCTSYRRPYFVRCYLKMSAGYVECYSIWYLIFLILLVSVESYFLFPLLNPLKPELNPICYLLALLGAHHFLHVSRIRVKLLTLR